MFLSQQKEHVCLFVCNKTRSMLCSFLLLFITKEKCAVFLSPFVYCLKEKGTQQLMIIDDNCINYINNKQKNKGTQNASPLESIDYHRGVYRLSRGSL